MKTDPHLVVALGLEDHDADTIRFAAQTAAKLGAARITFVHVIPSHDLDHAAYRVFPDLRNGIFIAAENQAKEAVARAEIAASTKVDFRVIEGSPMIEIVRLVRAESADLLIIGRREKRHWSDHLPMRIVRKAPTSVLVVPEGASADIQRILVPVDFSDRSRLALEEALDWGQRLGAAAVRAMHAWAPPPAVYFSHDLPGPLAESVRKSALDEWEDFIADIDFRGREPDLSLVEHSRAAGAIHEAAEAEKSDLVVVGSRGRTAAAAILLGSVAERAVADAAVPVLVVREPGDNETFLETLFEA